jgi:hypothetical protein
MMGVYSANLEPGKRYRSVFDSCNPFTRTCKIKSFDLEAAIISGADSVRHSSMGSSLGAAGASISGMRMSGVNNVGNSL